ncbi:unnamed protein product [Caenorhabditis brenneri]
MGNQNMFLIEATIHNRPPVLVPNPCYIPPVMNSPTSINNSNIYLDPSSNPTSLMPSTIPPMIQIPPIQTNFPQNMMGNGVRMNLSSEFHMFPSPMSPPMNSFEFNEAELGRKVNVGKLDVRTTLSSQKILLEWPRPATRKPVKFIIIATKLLCGKMEQVIADFAPAQTFFLPTIPGHWYHFHIQCKSTDDRYLVAEWSKQFRAEFDHDEYRSLLAKSQNFLKSKRFHCADQQFQFIYRCKPKEYWEQISNYSNGIMQKYMKDGSGHPGSRINGKLKGLFFSAHTTNDGSMPHSSYFGNTRMACAAFDFLNPMVHNFYFADFYCNTNRHYVIIVICVSDSKSDTYCKENLIKLDPYRNEFLRVESCINSSFVRWNFYVNKCVIVELFYTEDVSINIGNFASVTPAGAGTSREHGVPNNKNCQFCN